MQYSTEQYIRAPYSAVCYVSHPIVPLILHNFFSFPFFLSLLSSISYRFYCLCSYLFSFCFKFVFFNNPFHYCIASTVAISYLMIFPSLRRLFISTSNLISSLLRYLFTFVLIIYTRPPTSVCDNHIDACSWS